MTAEEKPSDSAVADPLVVQRDDQPPVAHGVSPAARESAESTANSVVLLCQEVGVDVDQFLTSDVCGQATVMSSLTSLSKRLMVYHKEHGY